MRLLLLFAAAAGAWASPLIVTDPILITGSGSWFTTGNQSGSSAAAYGMSADGITGAAFSYSCDAGGGPGVFAYHAAFFGQCAAGSASIGGVPYRYMGSFSVNLPGSGGMGLFEIFDFDGSLLASVPVIGYIVETSHITDPGFREANGTFNIVPNNPAIQPQFEPVVGNPEPGTVALMALGILLIVRRRAVAGPLAR